MNTKKADLPARELLHVLVEGLPLDRSQLKSAQLSVSKLTENEASEFVARIESLTRDFEQSIGDIDELMDGLELSLDYDNGPAIASPQSNSEGIASIAGRIAEVASREMEYRAFLSGSMKASEASREVTAAEMD